MFDHDNVFDDNDEKGWTSVKDEDDDSNDNFDMIVIMIMSMIIFIVIRSAMAWGQSGLGPMEDYHLSHWWVSRAIDGFTNFMHTILTKVVHDNLKACRFVWHCNN